MYERMLNNGIVLKENTIKEFIEEKAFENKILIKKALEKIMEIKNI
jgi:hypothetical protein